MRTNLVQCSVSTCKVQCSDQDREYQRVPGTPADMGPGWSWFRPSFSAMELTLCPSHTLALHLLLDGQLDSNQAGRAEAAAERAIKAAELAAEAAQAAQAAARVAVESMSGCEVGRCERCERDGIGKRADGSLITHVRADGTTECK